MLVIFTVLSFFLCDSAIYFPSGININILTQSTNSSSLSAYSFDFSQYNLDFEGLLTISYKWKIKTGQKSASHTYGKFEPIASAKTERQLGGWPPPPPSPHHPPPMQRGKAAANGIDRLSHDMGVVSLPHELPPLEPWISNRNTRQPHFMRAFYFDHPFDAHASLSCLHLKLRETHSQREYCGTLFINTSVYETGIISPHKDLPIYVFWIIELFFATVAPSLRSHYNIKDTRIWTRGSCAQNNVKIHNCFITF